MGEVVRLSDYQRDINSDSREALRDGLVPIEFAIGFAARDKCLSKIADYGVRSIHVRMVNEETDAYLYLIGVRDAIWINKKILECEEIGDEEITKRIDLIQMMENMDLTLMDSMWESISRQSQDALH